MNSQSSFQSDSWRWFYFGGEPQPGVDYTWIKVQNSVDFVGIDSCITNCQLFYSGRNPTTLLVRTEDKIDEIWDITDLSFTIIASNSNILEFSDGERVSHLSGITPALIDLLINARKLPPESTSYTNHGMIPIKISYNPSSSDSQITKIPPVNCPMEITVFVSGISQDIIQGSMSMNSDTILISQAKGNACSIPISRIKNLEYSNNSR